MSFGKDTISSSEVYYNNKFRFDHGARIGQQRIAHAKFLDTLETRQQKIDRHIYNQFKNNHDIPPHSKFVYIAQVGKYLILAVILPPYYMLYQGPKYVIIQLEPVWMLTVEKMGQVLMLLMNFGIDFWTGLGKKIQKPKNLIKKNIQTLNKALESLQVRMVLRLKEVFQPFKVLVHRIHNYTNTFIENYLRVLTWVRNFSITIPQKVKLALPNLKKVFVNKIKNGMAYVVMPFKRMAHLISTLSTKVGEVFIPFISFISRQWVTISKPIKQQAKNIMIQIKKIGKQTSQAARGALQLSIIKPVKAIYKAIIKPINAIKKVSETFLHAAVQKTQVLLKVAQSTMLLTLLPLQLVSKTAYQWSKGAKRDAIEKLKIFGPAIKRVLKSFWNQGKRRGSQGYIALKKMAKEVSKVVEASFMWVFNKIKQIPSKLIIFFRNLISWIIHNYRRAVFAGRIILAWTKVLVRYSLHHLWS